MTEIASCAPRHWAAVRVVNRIVMIATLLLRCAAPSMASAGQVRTSTCSDATVRCVLVLALCIAPACGGGNSAPTAPTPIPTPTPTPTELSISSPDGFSGTLMPREPVQFRADLEYSDGSVREGVSAEWSSSDPSVATVSESGLVTARQPGVFDLTASAEGLTSTHDGLRVVPAPAPPPPPRPVDPRFNDLFWRQLVFNQFDELGQRHRISVLEHSCLNVYIRRGDSTGQRRIVSDAIRDHIAQAVPQLAYQLTGQPYGCRIESGMEDRTQAGWMTVRFFADGSSERTSATVGADPGNIWIWLGYTDGREKFGHLFPRVFAHEFGHAMGFRHVAETAGMPKPVMARAVSQDNPGPATFTAAEQYHAQLAYEIGRGREYCGWPLQEVCATPHNQGAAWVPPHVVID